MTKRNSIYYSAPDMGVQNIVMSVSVCVCDTIRYDTRCYFNVRSKADISQLNLPHGTDN